MRNKYVSQKRKEKKKKKTESHTQCVEEDTETVSRSLWLPNRHTRKARIDIFTIPSLTPLFIIYNFYAP